MFRASNSNYLVIASGCASPLPGPFSPVRSTLALDRLPLQKVSLMQRHAVGRALLVAGNPHAVGNEMWACRTLTFALADKTCPLCRSECRRY